MKALAEQIADIDSVNIYGRVVGVRGLMVEVDVSDWGASEAVLFAGSKPLWFL